MKLRLILVLALLASFFISCKNEKSVDDLEVVKPVEIETAFKVTLNVTVKKDDNLSLFYTTDGSIDFTKIPPIWKEVKGNDLPQKVEFLLPEGVLPTQLRLDFGINDQQEDIVLSNVIFSYIGKEKNIGCPDLVSYFRADENKCSFDHVTGLIKAKVIDGKRQYPSLYPHEKALGEELDKIVK
ncbi:MAG: hypothetical protein EKK56_03860 [Flavobacteriaceae bacterium]|nr:MAG: hypothetical protein EKK56_03860 [Flavobacteriaceae bacterium]